jgi:hypothetical protein
MASSGGTAGVDGRIEWRDDAGRLRRTSGPARVSPSGREEWFRHGRLHREDGLALIHANGSVKYYLDGEGLQPENVWQFPHFKAVDSQLTGRSETAHKRSY